MNDTAFSVVLLASVVIALIVMRSRGMATLIAIESVLLLAIGAFLIRQGNAPLRLAGTAPAGMFGAWSRALAITWWLLGARLVVNLTVVVRGRDPMSREAKLFSDLAAAVIYVTAILIILNSVLDLNVRGLLLTSGVIAVAIGLAAQSTLADVFSGVAVSLEHPFHLGDRVALGENVEGVIVQVNWRSIHVRTDDDALATVPNSVVAKGQIINHSVPTRRRAVTAEIVTPPEATPERVIELIRQACLLSPLVLATPAASITLRRAGLRSNTYAVNFFVSDSPEVSAARSMLLLQARRLFRHAGISGSAPMSTVELLGSLALFEALSPGQLEVLAKDLLARVVEPGDTIFEQGAVARSLYVIESGVMEATRRDSHAVDHDSGRFGAGGYVGELGLITGMPRAYTLKALTEGRVLELGGDSLTRLLKFNGALNATMERSVRKGLALIERQDSAAADHSTEHEADLLARVRAFFHV